MRNQKPRKYLRIFEKKAEINEMPAYGGGAELLENKKKLDKTLEVRPFKFLKYPTQLHSCNWNVIAIYFNTSLPTHCKKLCLRDQLSDPHVL